MTYNIHVGVGMDKKLDLQRIANVINRERPDLVGLQEVDRGVKRTEGKDEIAELAALTQMQYAFAPNLDFQGGKYGVAILSRFPIRNTVHRMFENKREAERRGMLLVEVEIDRQPLTFVTTHLDYQFEDGRLFETEQLLKHLAEVKGRLIVVADLNDVPSGSAYQLMRTKFDDAWVVSRAKGDGFTYPADKPAKRIDHVFSSQGVKAKKAWVVETLVSDHVPVVAEVELSRTDTQHVSDTIDWPLYQDMAVDLMQQYLRIDTSNPLRSQFANIRESLKNPAFVKSLTSQREYNFLLRNTISITMLSGSKQTNVIPVAATCNIDVRLLPGESPDEFLKALTAVIADPTIKIENVNRFKPPNSSSVETELFSLIARRTKANHPNAIITTKMLSGYTESQLYRQLGITAYGWAPIYTTADDDDGVHGNNERISVKNVRQGTREFYEVVRDISR